MNLTNWEPFIFASDLHGNLQDRTVVKSLLNFCADWKPKYRVFGGDLFELTALRRGASEDEKKVSLLDDVTDSLQFVQDYKPTDFLLGNHDDRLWMLAKAAKGPISDLAQKAINDFAKQLKLVGCKEPLPYDKRLGILDIGKLRMLHGFGSGINCARRMAFNYGSLLMGHLHTVDIVSVEGLEKRMARVVGCLCQLDMEFNKAMVGTLRQAHGFAYGVVHKKTGLYHVWQAERVADQWLLPTQLEKY